MTMRRGCWPSWSTPADRCVAFIPSRRVAELVALRAREQLRSPARIESYRSGYLATDRRRLEHDLQTGAVNGVAATNALELGVDISGLDAVVISGFPGTRAALWQQAGRAGRRGTEALVVLIAAAQSARRVPVRASRADCSTRRWKKRWCTPTTPTSSGRTWPPPHRSCR